MTDRERILAWFLLCIAGALFVVWFAGCGGAVPRGEPPESETPWCLRFRYTDPRDRLRTVQSCFEAESVCAEAAEKIRRWGHLAHVHEVGACEEQWP
jgi:hypothetical protein